MAEGLKINSTRAQQCATLFLNFKDYLPASTEGPVTNIVTELFGVSRALLELKKSIENPRNERYIDIIDKERDTVSRSITHTLQDIFKQTSLIDELRERGLEKSPRAKDAYPVVWNKLARHFADEGERVQGCETLVGRLDTYVHYLKDLKAKLDGDTHSQSFRDIRYRLEKLLAKQEKNFEEGHGLDLKRLSLGPDVPKFEKKKSWDRKRPPGDSRGPSRVRRNSRDRRLSRDKRPGHDRKSSRDRRWHNSTDSEDTGFEDLVDTSDEHSYEDLGAPVDWEMDDDLIAMPAILNPQQASRWPAMSPKVPSPFSPNRPNAPSMGYFAPVAPEPPFPATGGFASPTSSAATPSTLSSETASSGAEHWLPVAFGLSRPSTGFKTTGSESGCFGDHDPSVVSHLRDQYDQILKIGFEDAHIELRIFLRDSDRRAKILIRQDRGNRKLIACEAVASLRILRHESCLQLCQPAKAERGNGSRAKVDRSKVFLWTMLRFPTYERMVLFWCSFHALKMQDEAERLERLEDAALGGEECLFMGVIDDDNYRHALHILRDRDSRGLRLQASALSGHFKRCPVWTAFITYQVASTSWARRTEARKIHLQDLTRYVFMDDYEPQLGPRGEHEIKFLSSSEAKKFYDTLDDIAEGKK